MGLAFIGGFRIAAEPANRWVEVRSPHFCVASDASVSQARSLAYRFERVRALFQKAFPEMRVVPRLPIVILAARDKASFASLEPPSWSKQGELARSGMMLRNPDENFILLLLGVAGENSYHVVCHEYAHLVLEDDFKNIPLWINEGLAQFYGDSDVDRKTVRLGLPSQQALVLLREHKLLPLETLFKVNQTSPYYNEEGEGNIFYAESWALTDYLMFSSSAKGRGPIDDYLALVAGGQDPVSAATAAFGDLEKLRTRLQKYVDRSAFGYYKLKVAAPAGANTYQEEQLTPAQSEALRGDFMARTGNLAPARTLLLDALGRDPQLVSVDQSMGLVELHSGRDAQAAIWFAKAAASCSDCALARFYNALALMQEQPDRNARHTIQTELEAFIRLNPDYAPPYAALARWEAASSENLTGARVLAARARELDPRNLSYLFLEGGILLKMSDSTDALRLARQAVSDAQSPQEKSQAYIFLGTIQANIETAGSGKR